MPPTLSSTLSNAPKSSATSRRGLHLIRVPERLRIIDEFAPQCPEQGRSQYVADHGAQGRQGWPVRGSKRRHRSRNDPTSGRPGGSLATNRPFYMEQNGGHHPPLASPVLRAAVAAARPFFSLDAFLGSYHVRLACLGNVDQHCSAAGLVE